MTETVKVTLPCSATGTRTQKADSAEQCAQKTRSPPQVVEDVDRPGQGKRGLGQSGLKEQCRPQRTRAPGKSLRCQASPEKP